MALQWVGARLTTPRPVPERDGSAPRAVTLGLGRADVQAPQGVSRKNEGSTAHAENTSGTRSSRRALAKGPFRAAAVRTRGHAGAHQAIQRAHAAAIASLALNRGRIYTQSCRPPGAPTRTRSG